MKESELNYYNEIGNWNFSQIKRTTDVLTNWDFFEQIKQYTDENSLCLDLGTGGGERVLKEYPNVGMIIATDFSKEMLKTANHNLINFPNKKVKFVQMDNLNMNFPDGLFDLVSARHTPINAKQIYNVLKKNGVLVIEGIDKKDCCSLKDMFKRGQAYSDNISISEKDYNDIEEAGFSKIEKVKILQNEYYETKQDLLALLIKVPILDDFSEMENNNFEHKKIIEKDIFDKYVEEYSTKRGILLERVLYGIVAIK